MLKCEHGGGRWVVDESDQVPQLRSACDACARREADTGRIVTRNERTTDTITTVFLN